MILELLEAKRLLAHERAQLSWMLRHGCCYPSNVELADRAAELGYGRPPQPQLGETAVVTVSEGRTRSCLYSFGPAGSGRAAVPFSVAVHSACGWVAWLVAQALGALRPQELTVRRAWACELIARQGEGLDSAIDGPSLAVAMGLAIASMFLRKPVPTDLLATAAIDAEGRTVPVGGLDAKIAMIASNALGVRRVLVATSQIGEARRAVESAPRALEIIGVESLQDAFAVAFEFRFQRDELAAFFDDLEVTRDVANRLFDLIVDGTSAVLDWHAVRRIAQSAAERLDDAEGPMSILSDASPRGRARLRARERIAIAVGVVSRHAGYPSILPWPREDALASMPRPRRLRLLAHLVQSAADWDDAEARTYVERAIPILAPTGDQTEGDLVLRGAIGRALVAIEAYDEARDFLDQALEGWQELGAHFEASFALAERLWLSGLQRDGALLDRLVQDALPAVVGHPRTSETSAAYLAFAVGRANTLLGRLDLAQRWLTVEAGVDWRAAPSALSASRLRWLARAHVEAGEHADSAKIVAMLDSGNEESEDQLLLARLDASRTSRASCEEIVHALQRHRRVGREISRITERARLARPSTPVDVASLIADRYRY